MSAVKGLLALALALVPLRAQEPAKSAAAPAPSRVERIVVIGASLSAGFGTEPAHTFAQALDASLRAPHAPPVDLGDVLFFASPLVTGPREIEAALDAEPTLVVALDFLFWFGYGTYDANGGSVDSEDERVALLERGLTLLDDVECPLVIGDFPDMSAAVGKMLAPEQMPAQSTLPRLSARVRAWAAERENTFVLPLADLVKHLATATEPRIGRHAFPAGTRLLQADDLHPNLQGLAATAQLVCDELVRHDLARDADFDFELPAVLRKLRALPAATGALR